MEEQGAVRVWRAVRWAWRDAVRRPMRWLGGAAVFLWVVIPFTLGVAHAPAVGTSGPGRVAVWAANLGLFGLLAAAMLLRQRDVAGVPWLFAVVTAGALLLYGIAPRSPAAVLGYVAVGIVTARLSARLGVALALLGIAGTVTAQLTRGAAYDFWGLVAYIGVFFAAITARERDALKASENRGEVLAERARIAREIHDILAHSLSAQIVHLEGARLLLDQGADTERVRERVERAQRLARSGLEETRRSLATLRGDAPAPDEALAELAEDFRAVTGRPCDVEIVGPSRDLSAQAGLAVVRTAQEALTNVRRHAPGARAVVRLRYEPGGIELAVTDSGGHGGNEPAATVGSGYGLVGMRERAELIGGTLEAGRLEEGFRVLLKVPT